MKISEIEKKVKHSVTKFKKKTAKEEKHQRKPEKIKKKKSQNSTVHQDEPVKRRRQGPGGRFSYPLPYDSIESELRIPG